MPPFGYEVLNSSQVELRSFSQVCSFRSFSLKRCRRSRIDVGDAPSIPLVTGLIDMGAKVKAFDPDSMEQAKSGACPALLIARMFLRGRRRCYRHRHRMGAVPCARHRPAEGDHGAARHRRLAQIYRPEEMAADGFVYESPLDGPGEAGIKIRNEFATNRQLLPETCSAPSSVPFTSLQRSWRPSPRK